MKQWCEVFLPTRFQIFIQLNSLKILPQFHHVDRRFLALGFGGMVNGRVSHCFPLNGNSREPYCFGIGGVIDAYYDSLENGTFWIMLMNNNDFVCVRECAFEEERERRGFVFKIYCKVVRHNFISHEKVKRSEKRVYIHERERERDSKYKRD